MVVKYCYTHKAEMPEKTSKSKRNPDGSYKVYNSHMDVNGKMCFGVGDPPKEDKQEWIGDNIEASTQMVEGLKEDFDTIVQDKPTEEVKSDLDEIRPRTKRDWNVAEFIKGIGVFSSPARSEGMNPAAAFENMAIWEWMDLSYGDWPGYEEWKVKAKSRIK